jgi:hypothetical protein
VPYLSPTADVVIHETGLQVGYWRWCHALNSFAYESFVDEMARRGPGPYVPLGPAHTSRAQARARLAAEDQVGQAPPARRGASRSWRATDRDGAGGGGLGERQGPHRIVVAATPGAW